MSDDWISTADYLGCNERCKKTQAGSPSAETGWRPILRFTPFNHT